VSYLPENFINNISNVRNAIGLMLLVVFPVSAAFSSAVDQPVSAGIGGVGEFHVSVFNCTIALPAEYVLNTRERDYFSFVKKLGGTGRISIDTYDDSIKTSDELEIIEKKIVGDLTILFIKVKWDLSTVVVIHDHKDGIRIIGDDVMLWENIVRVCGETEK